nr:GATA type zinc finger protein asd-4 [Bactrocera oleae]
MDGKVVKYYILTYILYKYGVWQVVWTNEQSHTKTMVAMLGRREQLALLLLAIFAFQQSEGFFKKLITIENDGIDEESNEHVNIKFPTIKLLKPFNLFEKKKEKLDKTLGSLVENKLEKWEEKKEKFDEKLLELFDFFKEKKTETTDVKTPAPAPAVSPVYEPPSAYGPAPVYRPQPAPAAPAPAPTYGQAPAPSNRTPAPTPAYGPIPVPAPAYQPPSAYSHQHSIPSSKYGHPSDSYSHYKSSKPAASAPHHYYVEHDYSEEQTYSYKPIQSVRPKSKPRPKTHYADCDYEVRYFT